ncbi:MAG TPA: SRPBCC family protein [Ilumatobacter sp.]|nr:SRPBCC family protein [Ilumatobacter sp.]
MSDEDLESRHPWHEKYPEMGTEPIPIEPYISPAHYQAEVEHVFKKSWIMVGEVAEIPNPGDFKAKKIHFANTSVILVHGKDGVIRGFHNICSHRGNTIVSETGEDTYGSNRAAVLTCRFHGWVYDQTGELVDVPDEPHFYACFHREDNGLAPVHTDVWNGIMFIHIDDHPEQTLDEYLSGVTTILEGYRFDEIGWCANFYRTVFRANWKVVADAFAEAYHTRTIHGGSYPNLFETEMDDVRFPGEHRVGSTRVTKNMNLTRVQKISQSLDKSSPGATERDHSELPPGINPGRHANFGTQMNWLFPNSGMGTSNNYRTLAKMFPIGHDQVLLESKRFARKPTTYSQLWAFEFAKVLQRAVMLEDSETMENTYRAMTSGVKTHMHLQDHEILLRRLYINLNARIDKGMNAGGQR